MDNGQHEQLLREVLMNLERLGGDLSEKAQWARNHGLCSEPPGTQGYNNKCKFDDGLFMCVRQIPGERGRWNYVVMGRGKEITYDQPPDQIRWKPDDSEIVDYARAIAPWVASVIQGQERASRACGGEPSSLQAYGKPCQRNPLRLILFAAFAGFMILYLVKTAFRNESPKSAIATMKADVAQTATDERQNEVESKTRTIQANEIEKKRILELSPKKVAELEEAKKKGVEQALAFLAERGETKDAEKLRGLLEAGKIDDAWELAKKHIVDEYEELQATKTRLAEELEAARAKRQVAERDATARREVEKAIEVLDKVGETKNAEKLRGVLGAGNINEALDLAAQQVLAWAEKRPDPWSRSELSSANRAAMMDKARVFGVSFATVVAYEMARARVPTSRILKTMKTYDSLNEYLLQQIDRINKHVDDPHLHYRLWKLSSAIDDVLSEPGRAGR